MGKRRKNLFRRKRTKEIQRRYKLSFTST